MPGSATETGWGRWLAIGWLVVAGSDLAAQDWSREADTASMIVVAIAEKADPTIAAGATPRGYDGLPGYDGSGRSIATAARLASDYRLAEVTAWTIEPLQLRCMVYRSTVAETPADLLQRLRQDRRVRIAQPLQEFHGLGTPSAMALPTGAVAEPLAYNDPYHPLQANFALVQAAPAQRWSAGKGSRIAVIDTAIDAAHPDLAGRIVEQSDLVSGAKDVPALADADLRHGTEVAGVIAAVANNGIGIVGIAPSARILSLRACWATVGDTGARCNTFTLALALAAAIADDARIINLSLGGPADPLLQALLEQALRRGAIVVGAVPPDGRRDGFPVNVDGVIAVAASDDAAGDASTLRAPGRDILTLQPGGHYDYAGGSSLAAAEVSAAIALMLELQPHLDAATARERLLASRGPDGGTINVCRALAGLPNSTDTGCDALPAIPTEMQSTH